jgi:hypothetical protein
MDNPSVLYIQTLEDLLHACMLSCKGNWEGHLALAEFVYNKNYNANIKMAPYESYLYGRECISPLYWEVPSERLLVGLDWIQQTHEKVHQIQHIVLIDQS